MITAIKNLSSFKAYNFASNNKTNMNSRDYSFHSPLKSDTVTFTGTTQKATALSDNLIESLKDFIKPLTPNFRHQFNVPTVQRLSVIHLVPPNGASEKIHIKCLSRELSSTEKYVDFMIDMNTKKILEDGKIIKDEKLSESYEKNIPELLSVAQKHPDYPKS